VQQREHAGAADGEERHRFGESVDRGSPILPHQQQDRADKRPGVADADPPDEVDDRKPPRHGHVDAPDAHAARQQIADRADQHHHQHEAEAHADHPPAAELLRQHDGADLVGDRGEGVPRRDHRCRDQACVR
jgi:hypothetical protein